MKKPMTPEAQRLCEEMDAAVFSGDTFYRSENIDEFIAYLERWTKEAKLIKESNPYHET